MQENGVSLFFNGVTLAVREQLHWGGRKEVRSVGGQGVVRIIKILINKFKFKLKNKD
jgi:hypothetical protein